MTLLPEGEELRRALAFIADERTAAPAKKVTRIIEEACLRLSPAQEAWLLRIFVDGAAPVG